MSACCSERNPRAQNDRDALGLGLKRQRSGTAASRDVHLRSRPRSLDHRVPVKSRIDGSPHQKPSAAGAGEGRAIVIPSDIPMIRSRMGIAPARARWQFRWRRSANPFGPPDCGFRHPRKSVDSCPGIREVTPKEGHGSVGVEERCTREAPCRFLLVSGVNRRRSICSYARSSPDDCARGSRISPESRLSLRGRPCLPPVPETHSSAAATAEPWTVVRELRPLLGSEDLRDGRPGGEPLSRIRA